MFCHLKVHKMQKVLNDLCCVSNSIYMPELLFTKRIKRSADLMIVMKLNIET